VCLVVKGIEFDSRCCSDPRHKNCRSSSSPSTEQGHRRDHMQHNLTTQGAVRAHEASYHHPLDAVANKCCGSASRVHHFCLKRSAATLALFRVAGHHECRKLRSMSALAGIPQNAQHAMPHDSKDAIATSYIETAYCHISQYHLLIRVDSLMIL